MLYSLLRVPEVTAAAAVSRSTLYALVAKGLWPAPVKLGMRSVGWPEGEVETLNRARIAGLRDDDIRQLVVHLEAERQANAPRIDEPELAAAGGRG